MSRRFDKLDQFRRDTNVQSTASGGGEWDESSLSQAGRLEELKQEEHEEDEGHNKKQDTENEDNEGDNGMREMRSKRRG